MMHMLRLNNKEHGVRVVMITFLGLALTVLAFSFSKGISGNDFWWHIKIGQWILENGTVPTTDIFSWYGTAHEIPWTAHEWLSDIIFYLVYSFTGELGVFVLSLGAALLITCMLWREAKKYTEESVLLGGVYFVLLAITTSVFFYGRPHLFSFFLLYIELKVLYRFFKDPNSKGIYIIPALTCLWSNLHGGFASLSYVLCAVFSVVSMLCTRIGKIEASNLDKKASLQLAVVTILSVAAILVNPVGLDVLLYPYKSFGDQLQMTLISEWRSPDAKNIGDLILFILPVTLMLICFIASEKRIRLIDMAVMGIFTLLFLRSVRFIMLWYIAAVFCAFPYLPKHKIKASNNKVENILMLVCMTIFVLIAGLSVKNIFNTAKDDGLISVAMSDKAVAVVKEDEPERIFNDYNVGETLIYNDIPVFFDARADLYVYDHLMADGVSLLYMTPVSEGSDKEYVNVEALIEKYSFDAFLILKTRPLYSYIISHSEQFTCVYEDDSIAYFRVIG